MECARAKSLITAVLLLTLQVLSVTGAAPVIDPSYATLYVLEYRTLNMTCTSVGSNTLVWEKGQTRTPNLGFRETQRMDVDPSGASTITSTISKAAASESDSGQYSCKSDDPTPRTIEVKVVTVVTTNAEFKASVESVSLSCFPSSLDTSLYSVHWELLGNTLSNSDRYTILPGNSSLQIKALEPSDGGTYFCELEFDQQQVLKVPVDVYVARTVKKSHQSKSITPGDPMTLQCGICSHPPAKITWLKNGQSVDNTDHIVLMTSTNSSQVGDVLQIRSFNETDQAVYTCNGLNSYFNKTAFVTINVTVTPNVPVAAAAIVRATFQVYLLLLFLFSV